MPTIRTKNLNIQYRQAGGGDIPLVFLHGNYASSRWWLPQFERLPPILQAFAPDLRGCGTPEGITQPLEQQDGRLNIHDLSTDLAEFISALNLENPILIGHSLGGVIATDYALRYPGSVRGLLLEDTGPPNGVHAGFLAQSLLMPLEFGSKILMRNALRFAGLPRRGDLAKDLVQDAVTATPGQYLAFAQAVSNWDVELELSSLDIPLLLVWGGKDRIMSPAIANQYLRLLPQATLLMVPDAGHSPHLERPNAFAGALRQFVDQCVSQPETTFTEVTPRSLVDRISRWMRISIFGS
jgi:branched-chain amino acid transport system permease protein